MAASNKTIKTMNKTELQEYALALTAEFNDIKESFSERLSKLEEENDSKSARLEQLEGLVNVNKSVSATLATQLVKAERVNTNNSQYLRRRQIELWGLPDEAVNGNTHEIKSKAASILSLTGVHVAAEDIDVCHKLKKKGRLIAEFHSRDKRDNIIRSRKNLKHKKNDLGRLQCPKLSIVESMCPEYKKLDWVCRSLKAEGHIEKTWFYQRKLIVESEKGQSIISHIQDLYEVCPPRMVNPILEKSGRGATTPAVEQID